MKNYAKDCQIAIRDVLTNDPEIKKRNIRFILQDDADLRFLIDTELGKIDQLIAVISIDRLTPEPPAMAIEATVMVTELVPVNRAYPGFTTAMEAAQLIGEALTSHSFNWEGTEQKSIEDAALITETRIKCVFQ